MATVKLYKYAAQITSGCAKQHDSTSPLHSFFTADPISEAEKKNTNYQYDGEPEVGTYRLPEGFCVKEAKNGLHLFYDPKGRQCSLELEALDGTPKLGYFIPAEGEEGIRFSLQSAAAQN